MIPATPSTPWGRVLCGFVAVLAVAIVVAAAPSPARADAWEAVADERLTVRETTPGFVFETDGRFPAFGDLVRSAEAVRARITTELGHDFDGPTRVQIARSPEVFAALQPDGVRLPDWAVAVAWAQENRIVIGYFARNGDLIDLDVTFAHELSHIALGRIVPRGAIPHWFAEGLAMHQAREWSLDRHRQLLMAVVTGRVAPLDRLARGFPREHRGASLAYTQSMDFVGHLAGHERPDTLPVMLDALRMGMSFDEALARGTASSLAEVEGRWMERLGARYGWIPLIATDTTLWAAVGALAVLAALLLYRRRRAQRRRLELQDIRDELRAEFAGQLSRPAPPPVPPPPVAPTPPRPAGNLPPGWPSVTARRVRPPVDLAMRPGWPTPSPADDPDETGDEVGGLYVGEAGRRWPLPSAVIRPAPQAKGEKEGRGP